MSRNLKLIGSFLLFFYFSFFSVQKIIAQVPCNTPVYVAFMTHIEDNWLDDVDSNVFNLHASQMRNGVQYFKPYGAKFTAEVAIPFATGCYNWGDNVLQSLIDSTMGIGTHANSSSNFDVTKTLVDGLVGGANNRHVSGGCGAADTVFSNNWIDSAYQAGFQFVDGMVHFTYLNIPVINRPGMVSDSLILNVLYHDPVPANFNIRIHPHRASDGFDWINQTTGPILALTGSMGSINSLAEGYSVCGASCPLDSADIDSMVSYINQAVLRKQTTDLFTVVYTHNQLNLLEPSNQHLYDYLFTSLQPLVNSGEIQYGTMGEVYDAYVNCELTISVEDEGSEHFVKLYPNPASDFVHLQFQDPGYEDIKVKVIDTQGKLMATKFDQTSHMLDLSQLGSGMYYVLINRGGKQTVKKLIKY